MADQPTKAERWAVTSRRIAFWAGLIGVAYETVYENVDRPWLLLAFLTMMGVAQFGRAFEHLGKDDGVTITFGGKRPPPAPGPGSKEKTET